MPALWRQLRFFGITQADYDRMLSEQGNRCAICRREFSTRDHSKSMPCLDHDHKTNKLRKLLCFRCNIGISQFDESPKHLRSAAEYLECLVSK